MRSTAWSASVTRSTAERLALWWSTHVCLSSPLSGYCFPGTPTHSFSLFPWGCCSDPLPESCGPPQRRSTRACRAPPASQCRPLSCVGGSGREGGEKVARNAVYNTRCRCERRRKKIERGARRRRPPVSGDCAGHINLNFRENYSGVVGEGSLKLGARSPSPMSRGDVTKTTPHSPLWDAAIPDQS